MLLMGRDWSYYAQLNKLEQKEQILENSTYTRSELLGRKAESERRKKMMSCNMQSPCSDVMYNTNTLSATELETYKCVRL